MKALLINVLSVLASTILFVMILSFSGVLGPMAAGFALTGLKIIGWVILYIIMIRVPIALLKARELKEANKIRQAFNKDAEELLERSINVAKRDTVSIKKPSVDNPITPMPADPDLE